MKRRVSLGRNSLSTSIKIPSSKMPNDDITHRRAQPHPMASMAAGITRPKCSIWCQIGAKKWLLFVLFAARRCRSLQGNRKPVKADKQWLRGLFQSGDPNGIDSASPLPSGRPLVDLPRFWLGSNCVRIRLRRSLAVASDPNGIRIARTDDFRTIIGGLEVCHMKRLADYAYFCQRQAIV